MGFLGANRPRFPNADGLAWTMRFRIIPAERHSSLRPCFEEEGVCYDATIGAHEKDDVMAKTTGKNLRTTRFSFRRMALYGVALALALLIASAVMGAVLAVRDMRDRADVSLTNAKARIESSVAESFKLLESLAEQPTLYDRSVPVMDKVTMLDQVNEHFGYFLLCYVDDEMNVWDVTGSASLASRDFMQKCYSTGQGLVTDSFAAGADGVTLNYVVLVPLFDGGEMTGSLFVSLYFDDMVRILAESAVGPDVGSVLIGSRGQTMSATSGFVYDDMFLDPLRSSIAFGMTADVVERELMALNPVSFWTVDGLDVRYYTAVPIADTAWDAVCVTSFWDAYTKVMAALAPLIAAGLAIVAGVFLLLRRDFMCQMENARMLEKSVEELQRKVYDDGRSAEADIADILELTSSGLADGLTGTVTRSVFSSKLASALENARDGGSLYALCFIDLDDFKTINDTYGHATGDAALKSIGYALRGYERRYDGMVGRYGGDEFVMLMTDIDDEGELRAVLDEMVGDLHVDIQVGDAVVSVHCSIGAAVWDRVSDADALLGQADNALYRVKQHGKEGYFVFGEEDAQ